MKGLRVTRLFGLGVQHEAPPQHPSQLPRLAPHPLRPNLGEVSETEAPAVERRAKHHVTILRAEGPLLHRLLFQKKTSRNKKKMDTKIRRKTGKKRQKTGGGVLMSCAMHGRSRMAIDLYSSSHTGSALFRNTLLFVH